MSLSSGGAEARTPRKFGARPSDTPQLPAPNRPANQSHFQTAADYWRSNGQGGVVPPSDQAGAQVSLMTDYCSKFKGAREVPE